MVEFSGIGGLEAGLATANPYAAAAGAGLGAIGNIFGAGAPQIVTGLTEEDRDEALRRHARRFRDAEALNMAPINIGGYTLRGGGVLNKKQVRSKYLPEAAKAFLLSQGLDEEAASERVSGIENSNRPSFKKALGKKFMRFLKQKGGEYNLKVRKGKIKGRNTEVVPGSFSMEDLAPLMAQYQASSATSPASIAAQRIAEIFGGANG